MIVSFQGFAHLSMQTKKAIELMNLHVMEHHETIDIENTRITISPAQFGTPDIHVERHKITLINEEIPLSIYFTQDRNTGTVILRKDIMNRENYFRGRRSELTREKANLLLRLIGILEETCEKHLDK